MALTIVPLELRDVNVLIKRLHRHHKSVQGHRFSIGVINSHGILVGGCSVGRPVARKTNQSTVLEVTRLVTDGTYNACSILYAAAARVGRELGYERIQTFILDSELGASLKASGWKFDGVTSGGGWNRVSKPNRRQDQPQGPKQRYVKILNMRKINVNPTITSADQRRYITSLINRAIRDREEIGSGPS